MRFRNVYSFSLVMSLALFSGITTASAAQKAVRACLTSDLIGTWEMKSINAKIKIKPEDSFGWPYQRFQFDRRGDVKQITSTTPIEGNQPLIRKFNNAASTSRFSLDESGNLSITKLELPVPENCMCSYAMRDVPAEVLAKVPDSKKSQIPHQGDIVLTYKNRRGQPVVIKSLRRVG